LAAYVEATEGTRQGPSAIESGWNRPPTDLISGSSAENRSAAALVRCIAEVDHLFARQCEVILKADLGYAVHDDTLATASSVLRSMEADPAVSDAAHDADADGGNVGSADPSLAKAGEGAAEKRQEPFKVSSIRSSWALSETGFEDLRLEFSADLSDMLPGSSAKHSMNFVRDVVVPSLGSGGVLSGYRDGSIASGRSRSKATRRRRSRSSV